MIITYLQKLIESKTQQLFNNLKSQISDNDWIFLPIAHGPQSNCLLELVLFQVQVHIATRFKVQNKQIAEFRGAINAFSLLLKCFEAIR